MKDGKIFNQHGLRHKYLGMISETKLVTLMNFNRVALAACRAMWAQLNFIPMNLGLFLLLGTGPLCNLICLFGAFCVEKRLEPMVNETTDDFRSRWYWRCGFTFYGPLRS